MQYVMKIIGKASGLPTEFDGQFLLEYDPTRKGHMNGRTIIAHIVTVSDPSHALKFDSFQSVMKMWKLENGTRPYDGKPNRPLTAFTIEPLPLERAIEEAANGS